MLEIMNNRTNLTALHAHKITDWEPHFSALGINKTLLEQAFFQDNGLVAPNLYTLYMNCARFIKDGLARHLNIKIQYGWQLCALSGERHITQLALKDLPSLIPSETPEGMTPFHHIACAGDVYSIKAMLGEFSNALTIKDHTGFPVIHSAMSSGSLETVDFILTHYPHLLDTTNDAGSGLLHYAAKSGNVEVIKRVIHAMPTKIEACNNYGHNILFFATMSGSIDAFIYLTTQYPKLKERKGKYSLFHAALLSGNEEFIAYLKENTLITKDISPDLACAAALSQNMRIINGLLNNSAFKALGDHDQIAYHFIYGAFILEDLELVKFFLRKYPTLDHYQDEKKQNILMLATLYSSAEVVHLILSQFPHLIGTVSDNDANPLHFAATRYSDEILNYFIKKFTYQNEDNKKIIDQLLHEEDIFGDNITNYAARKGSFKLLDYSIQIKYEFFNQLMIGLDKTKLILCAAESGSIKKTAYCLELANHPKFVENDDNQTILHAAACKPDLLEYLYINHPLLMKNSWQRDCHQFLPDETAISGGTTITPSRIRLSLIKKITAELIKGKLSEKQIEFLSTFPKTWIRYILNERKIANNFINNKEIIPNELREYLTNYTHLITLASIETEDQPLKISLLKSLIDRAVASIKQLTPNSSFIKPLNSILWKKPEIKLIKDLNFFLDKINKHQGDLLSKEMLITLRVIVADAKKEKYSDIEERVMHVFLRKLLSTSNLSCISPNPSKKSIDIKDSDFEVYYKEMRQSIDAVMLSDKIKKDLIDLFFPALFHYITNIELMAQHYQTNPTVLYILSPTNMPLHTDSAYLNYDVSAFKELFTNNARNLFSGFYSCKKAGKVADFLEKLTSAECFNARSRAAITYASHTISEIEEFNVFIAERYQEYCAYAPIMHALGERELGYIENFVDFILSRYKNHPCFVDEEYALDGRITEEGVARYAKDMLYFDNAPIEENNRNKKHWF